MRDSDVVASIVAGDPDGLADAYDRYADPLYKYCRSMLSDPADAADAVQDTFVIAASRLSGLRDPELLRPWLYAVARNECLQTARARRTTVAFDEAPEVTDDGVNVSEDAEQAELRTLLEDAARGLNPAEREAIELHLRQGLEAAEIAAVLGVSANHVHSLLSRARDQLQACLAALLVGRAGREECRELRGMLANWDGHLTVPIRKRIQRHIERCAICSARRAFELRPAMLLGLSPGAALIAGAAEDFRLAAGAPAGLKAHTLGLAIDANPSAVAHRAAVLGRAGSFGRGGFPRPMHAPTALPPAGGKGRPRPSARQVAWAAGVVVAVGVAAVAFALVGHGGHGTAAGGGSRPSASTAGASAAVAATPGTSAASQSPSPTATHPAVSRSPTPKTSPTATTASPTATPSPTGASTSPPPVPGTLVVNPAGGQLTVPRDGATITLKAQGGPVTWSISSADGVQVSQSSGTLTAGSTVTVTISARSWADGSQLTVSPGGTVFTLVVDREFHGGAPAAAGGISPLALPAGRSVFWLYDAIETKRTVTVTTCATARLSHPSWPVTPPGSPRPTTGTRTLCSVTAARCCASPPTPPTRCRTRSSSPPPGCRDCATRSCCAPGCTPWRATSACAG